MSLAPTPLVLDERQTAPPVTSAGLLSSCARGWHLLSLDAPSVAALWAWGMARALHIHLPWSAPLLLALGTWLIYIADRILDGVGERRHGAHLRDRHYFYIRQRRGFLAAGASGGLVLLWLIATRMTAAAFHEDLFLFALALLYFGLIHLCGPRVERWFPKEMAVGLVFASATAVPAWSRLAGHRLPLIPIIVLFATLCWMNCAAIEKWESTPKRQRAHVTTRWVQRRLQPIAAIVAALAIVGGLCAAIFGFAPRTTALYAACAVASLLLLRLDRGHFSAARLRIAADAALLTPLLLLLVP